MLEQLIATPVATWPAGRPTSASAAGRHRLSRRGEPAAGGGRGARLGRPDDRRQRHVRRPARRHRARLGRRRGLRRRASIASASRPTAGMSGFPRSARSAATGVAVADVGMAALGGRRAERGRARARGRASSGSCRSTSGSRRRTSSSTQFIVGRFSEREVIELSPLVLAAAADDAVAAEIVDRLRGGGGRAGAVPRSRASG